MVNGTCKEFIDALASGEPVPGGGGASALAGSLGIALGSMVANITLNSKKYENVWDDIKKILVKTESLKDDLAALISKDADGFKHVVKAMKMPKESDDEKKARDSAMQKALRISAEAPLEMMRKCGEALILLDELYEKGSKGVVSDVGVGAVLCGAALEGASLNVYANTKYMKNRTYAEDLNKKTKEILENGAAMSRAIYKKAEDSIR